MQISLAQLNAHLNNQLSPVYCIAGDEIPLVETARKKIIAVAKTRGFLEQAIFHIEPNFAWENVITITQNQSLFSEKQIIDIRNPQAKFDDTLSEWLKQPNETCLFIITTNKLTKIQQKSKWFLDISKIGVYCPIWPIERRALVPWIIQEGKKRGLTIDTASAELLAECTEGHLSATQQALEKLLLLYPAESIQSDKMALVLTDNARFTIFDLTRAVLLGNTNQVVKILSQLKKTDQELPLILWMITKDIRELLILHEHSKQGDALQQVYTIKKPLLEIALKNTTIPMLHEALILAHQIDRTFKSFQVESAWEDLLSLCVMLCKA